MRAAGLTSLIGAAFGAVVLAASLSTPAQALKCNAQSPDSCGTCDDVRAAFSGADPNTRVVRGRSVWSPLYAAYFKDCPSLAEGFLQAGAHPAIGGMEGDMLATVISWDRFDVETRKRWMLMLIRGGAKLDHPVITGMTTRQRLMGIVADYGGRDDILQLIAEAEAAGG